MRIVKNWKVIFPNCEKAFGNKREKGWNIGQPRINRVPSNNESFERMVFRTKLFSNSRESRKRSAEGYGDVSLYKRVLALSQSLATVSANLSRRIVLRPRWWHESSSRLALQCTSHPFQSYVGKGLDFFNTAIFHSATRPHSLRLLALPAFWIFLLFNAIRILVEILIPSSLILRATMLWTFLWIQNSIISRKYEINRKIVHERIIRKFSLNFLFFIFLGIIEFIIPLKLIRSRFGEKMWKRNNTIKILRSFS